MVQAGQTHGYFVAAAVIAFFALWKLRQCSRARYPVGHEACESAALRLIGFVLDIFSILSYFSIGFSLCGYVALGVMLLAHTATFLLQQKLYGDEPHLSPALLLHWTQLAQITDAWRTVQRGTPSALQFAVDLLELTLEMVPQAVMASYVAILEAGSRQTVLGIRGPVILQISTLFGLGLMTKGLVTISASPYSTGRATPLLYLRSFSELSVGILGLAVLGNAMRSKSLAVNDCGSGIWLILLIAFMHRVVAVVAKAGTPFNKHPGCWLAAAFTCFCKPPPMFVGLRRIELDLIYMRVAEFWLMLTVASYTRSMSAVGEAAMDAPLFALALTVTIPVHLVDALTGAPELFATTLAVSAAVVPLAVLPFTAAAGWVSSWLLLAALLGISTCFQECCDSETRVCWFTCVACMAAPWMLFLVETMSATFVERWDSSQAAAYAILALFFLIIVQVRIWRPRDLPFMWRATEEEGELMPVQSPISPQYMRKPSSVTLCSTASDDVEASVIGDTTPSPIFGAVEEGSLWLFEFLGRFTPMASSRHPQSRAKTIFSWASSRGIATHAFEDRFCKLLESSSRAHGTELRLQEDMLAVYFNAGVEILVPRVNPALQRMVLEAQIDEVNVGRVERLLECRVDPNMRTIRGDSMLIHAVRRMLRRKGKPEPEEDSHMAIVSSLLRHRADCGARVGGEPEGLTVLHLAAEKLSSQLVEELLLAGADRSAVAMSRSGWPLSNQLRVPYEMVPSPDGLHGLIGELNMNLDDRRHLRALLNPEAEIKMSELEAPAASEPEPSKIEEEQPESVAGATPTSELAPEPKDLTPSEPTDLEASLVLPATASQPEVPAQDASPREAMTQEPLPSEASQHQGDEVVAPRSPLLESLAPEELPQPPHQSMPSDMRAERAGPPVRPILTLQSVGQIPPASLFPVSSGGASRDAAQQAAPAYNSWVPRVFATCRPCRPCGGEDDEIDIRDLPSRVYASEPIADLSGQRLPSASMRDRAS